MLIYAIWIGNQALLRYDTFKATAFDLGNMDQAIWNTLHGRPFQFTNHGSDWYGYPIRLAQHVEPIILPLSLLYMFHADVHIILIFQTLALTSGALPVFLLTRRSVPVWPLLAPIMAAAYLLSPALISENLFDFHPVALATPLLLYAVLALTYRRYAWFVLCCILAAACKEEIPLVVAVLGLLVIWKYKLPRLGIVLLIVGIIWSLIAFLVIEPHFNIGAHTNNFWYRYARLGNSPKAAAINILLHPWLLFTTFFTLDRIYYVINLLRSTGFLALLGPEWLLPTLFSLTINLFSANSAQYSGVYHYSAAIIPFIMIAAINGARRFALLWCSWRGELKQLELLREANILALPAHQNIDVQETRRRLVLSSISQALRLRIQTIRTAIGKRAIVQRTLTTLRSRLIKSSDSFHARGTDLAHSLPVSLLQLCCVIWIVGMIALNYFIMSPKLNIFWANHQPGDREQHITQLLTMIPPDAPVSAGGNINPHLTERQYITAFPELDIVTMNTGKTVPAQYVIVDLENVSPENKAESTNFLNTLNWIERSHQFRVLAQAEGVILLQRNNP
ncbi:MAG TPA: DUF2079 domain-containing protein [Ktedonobacteraceae bacterium]|jgi:uncharacterized membrane protein